MARNRKPRRRGEKRTDRSSSVRHSKQLSFDQLESRHLLATFVVNSSADGPVDLTDSVVTLRDAITNANDFAGADTITFDASVFDGIADNSLIRLSGTELGITESLTIDASMASGVTITGDTNSDDFVDAMNITNVAASFGSVAGDLLDDNSRVLNFNTSSGDLTLRGLTVTGGRRTGAGADGGGIRFGGTAGISGTLTLDQTTVSGNSTAGTSINGSSSATARGGGVFTFDGSVLLTNSTVSGNSVSGLSGLGGGIYTLDGGVLLTNSTVSGNSSTRSGGGIYTRRGDVTLTNSTLSGNVAGDAGGGIAASSASVTLINSTASGNEAVGLAGGVFVRNSQSNDPSVTIFNSIVAGNQQNVTTPNIGTPNDLVLNLNIPLTINYSLIGVADSGLTAGQQAVISNGVGNLTGTSVTPLDPLLDLLADNGGPTQTHAILFGSPAINAGDPAITEGFDQRGQTRVQVGRVDIGAFESDFEAPSLYVTITSDTVASDGETSLREAIEFANVKPSADTIAFDASVFTGGTNSLVRLTGGELEVTDTLTIDGSTGVDVTITGDADGDDVTVGLNITDVAASFGGTAGGSDDLLDDNSRVLNFSSLTGDLSLESVTLTGGRTTGYVQYMFGPIDSTYFGGGIRFASSGSLSLSDSTLSGNSTSGDRARGGGIFTYRGDVSLTRSTLSGNSTSGFDARGGGVATVFGGVSLTSSTLSDNSTSGTRAGGGGINGGDGSVSLISSTLSGNSTSGSHAYGGGIRTVSGSVSLTNTTLDGNSTSGFVANGGGISTRSGAVSLVSSTLSGNSTARSFADGGGIYRLSGSLSLMSSTLSGNAASLGRGGGVYLSNSGSSFTIENSIIAGNRDRDGASDLAFRLSGTSSHTINHSLIGVADNLGTIVGNIGNQLGALSAPIDALLGPLAFNGGPTKTHALLPDSPAINAGDDNVIQVDDQRDLARNVNGVDIGAFERQAIEPIGTPPIVTSVTRDEGGMLDRPDLLSTISVSFDVDVSVSADDLEIRNDTLGGSLVDTSGLIFGYDASTQTATWDFSNLTLDAAFYSFELTSDIVSVGGNLSLDGDTDGNPGGGYVEPIYVALPGDANLDGQVNVLGDGFPLVSNLGATGGATWAQGDFNGDGLVNVLGDGFILVSRLGQSVVPPASASATSKTAGPPVLASFEWTPPKQQSVVLFHVAEDEEEQVAAVVPREAVEATSPELAGDQARDVAFAFEFSDPDSFWV